MIPIDRLPLYDTKSEVTPYLDNAVLKSCNMGQQGKGILHFTFHIRIPLPHYTEMGYFFPSTQFRFFDHAYKKKACRIKVYIFV